MTKNIPPITLRVLKGVDYLSRVWGSLVGYLVAQSGRAELAPNG